MSAMKKRHDAQPWSTADATIFINELGNSGELNLLLTNHAENQMLDRSLISGDVLHVLKRGFVYEEPEEATRLGFYKYAIEIKTPNSGSRTVRVICIPNCTDKRCKIVTVMWKDEQ